MPKVINKVEVIITAERNGADIAINESAIIFVTIEEYPDFASKKGIPVCLTTTQEDTIKDHIKTVILPQAEVAK